MRTVTQLDQDLYTLPSRVPRSLSYSMHTRLSRPGHLVEHPSETVLAGRRALGGCWRQLYALHITKQALLRYRGLVVREPVKKVGRRDYRSRQLGCLLVVSA